MEIEFDVHGNQKQLEASSCWIDNSVDTIVYGGSKGSGKSFLGVSLIFGDALLYPNTQYFIARKNLNDLRKYTTSSVHEVLEGWGISKSDYKYNGMDNYWQLSNGSKVFFLEAKYYPTDPKYTRFGSIQMTRGWVEEGGEIEHEAFINLSATTGRWMNDVYGINGKVLVTCNPTKNFLYSLFYKKFKTGILEVYNRFIQALPTDNKRLPSGYIDRLLRTLTKNAIQRLVYGNWEYDDDPDALCGIDEIHAIFENDHVQGGKKYLTADIARMGSDKAVLFVWDGWKVIEKITFDISKTTDIQRAINALRTKHQISKNYCVGDGDGVGGGVIDNTGIIEFKNGSKALNNENYFNLQTQCIYFLADKINKHEIYLECDFGEKEKEEIIEELEYLKSYNSDQEGKIRALPKEMIKENIGRSPDWRDALMMRAYFDLKPKNSAPVSSSSFKK